MNIGDIVSRAIKERKWLDISYLNKNDEKTYYWIAVYDIDFENKSLFVTMFNDKKSLSTFEQWISFERIKSAKVIDFSSYVVPPKLIDKIEKNLNKCKWLNYDHFNHNILNYYIECNILDNDPCQKEYCMIPGVDLQTLRQTKKFILNEEQERRIIADIYHYDIKNKIDSTFYTLAMNYLSIDEDKNKFVVCYYEMSFDPIQKSLVLGKDLRFNKAFMVEGRKHSLSNYINMDMDEFIENFHEKYREYWEIIGENLRPGEIINTRPEIMLIQRNITTDLTETYDIIETKYNNNQLPIPLKSFFGNITKRNNIRRKEPSIIIADENININQMRVLYNALKFPVTYVQGPPGTGKTKTIINVILSAFYNGKTVLVCSSNNKPIDGIVENLNFEYRGEKILLPYLRLGNFEDVKKATLKIKEMYKFTTDKIPKDDLLTKIKLTSDEKNAKLIQLLNIQEKRVDIEDCLESSKQLLESFNDNTSKVIEVVKTKVEELKRDLKNLPEVTNEEIVALTTPLNKDYYLSQFLFYKSIQYISKLKLPRYADLVAICYIEDDDERAMEFNKWLQNDSNMKKLIEAFPIILTTNISARRLGTPNFMFNLVIMDEAGQCNVATALLPIAKAESLLLVGDPNQLKPVIILEDKINKNLIEKYNVLEKYDYKQYSILDVMRANDNISKYILLKYHYRCGKKIIDFSNQRYYNNSLDLDAIKIEGEIKVLEVKNNNVRQRNEAIDEANAIADYIQRNNIHDAYIITPFVKQKEMLQMVIKNRGIDGVDCGTIHSLQGAERNTIILSTALSEKTSKKTFEWIKDNYELINVAVTRAKNKLVIAADTEWLNKLSDKKDDLYNLVKYAQNNGLVEVPPNEFVKIEIGKSNGSIVEDEFFKTISHFCSCHKTFETMRNVKLDKVIKKGLTTKLSQMEFDLVLFEKTFWGSKKPVIAFEINGGEHFGVTSREISDRTKMAICALNGIKLIMIPNSFVKSYEYIVDIIMASRNVDTSIQQSMFD